MSERLEAALQYAERGWAVLPLHGAWTPKNDNPDQQLRCSCIKGYKCKSKGKHPRNHQGSRGASKDFNTIKEWWDEWPMANIGIATGPASGFWVIDIDMKKGANGWDSMFDLWGEEINETKMGLCQKTPTGGFHILVDWDEEVQPANQTGVLANVDIRADGGFIVAYPSRIGGEQYIWNDENFEPTEWTTWMVELCQLSHQKKFTIDKDGGSQLDLESIYQSGIPDGERDNTMLRVAAKLRIMDIPYTIALFIMSRIGERCEPYDAEVQQMIVDKLDYAYERFTTKTKEERREYAQRQGSDALASALLDKFKK